MSERSKEGKKEALFGEQMGYLRSGVQASMMPKATGNSGKSTALEGWQGKNISSHSGWLIIRKYLKENDLTETEAGLWGGCGESEVPLCAARTANTERL